VFARDGAAHGHAGLQDVGQALARNGAVHPARQAQPVCVY
jgi:hypothetical protein